MNAANIIISLTWVMFLVSYYPHVEKQLEPVPVIEQQQPDTNTLNQSNVLRYATKIGVKFPEVYLRQCIMESGHNFEKQPYKTSNNIHGMYHPLVRKTNSLGEKGGYAIYESWRHCILDYKYWQEYWKKEINEIDNVDDYIKFLRTSGYIAGARKTYEKELLTLKLSL